MMTLVESHQYPKGSKHYAELDKLCFLSKNLYNSTLYVVRQHFINTGEYLNYSKINKLSSTLLANDYKALPAKVAQQIQRLVDSNFKSFFEKLKTRKSGEIIRMPKYLDKQCGRQVAMFTNQAISFNNRNIPNGYIRLSGTSFNIRTKVSNPQFARIVPHLNYITIEIGYYVETSNMKNSSNRFASIDIGVNNLATVSSNVFKPFIINGKPLKSINQYYNKKIAQMQSKFNRWTNKMYTINRKRNNKIKDYMHKASTYIVNQLVENRVDTLVIGHNDGWKQDTHMYKKNNQNFVQIPFNQFISMLTYKCEMQGINIVIQEESYTSKSSFLDRDYIPKYGVDDDLFNPSGVRCKRGLYKSANGTLINADINGSLNILRKYLTKQVAWNEIIFSNCVEVCSTPMVITIKT